MKEHKVFYVYIHFIESCEALLVYCSCLLVVGDSALGGVNKTHPVYMVSVWLILLIGFHMSDY